MKANFSEQDRFWLLWDTLGAVSAAEGEGDGENITLLQTLCQVLGAQSAGLFLSLDQQPGEMIQATYTHGNVQTQVIAADQGWIQECLRSRAALILPSGATGLGSADRGKVGASGNGVSENGVSENGLSEEIRSLLCAPLIASRRAIGVVAVFNKLKGDFDTGDRDLLALFAGPLAQAISNAQMVRQLSASNASLEALQRDLMNSRNTLRALFDSMPAALYIVDQQYKLMAINISCANRTGQSPKKLVGRKCYQALYGREDECPGCRVRETLATGILTNRSERRWNLRKESGEWEINSYPIFDDLDQVVQAILLEQDVTEKRRLESVLAQSEKLAAIGQLAAGVAHEINNPLTAIIANAQMIQRDLPPDEELQESVDLIIRAGARATQVIRNLLDFSRKEQTHLSTIDINETIQRSIALVQHELISRSIRLDFKPDPHLPQIIANQDDLQGVWLNMLLNAIDAMDKQEKLLRMATRRVGNEIWVSMEDNGRGIPEDQILRIFEPFYTTKAPGRGTGLGLSVSDRVIKQHGGQILVKSQEGVGTQFTVVLPTSWKK